MKKIVIPGLAAGVVMLVVSMAISYLIMMFMPSLSAEYTNANLFRPWSDPLMNLYFLYPFVLGLTLAWAWEKTKAINKEKDAIKRGAHFGISFWAVASVAGILMTYSCFPVSLAMAASWLLTGLIQAICAGIVYAKLNK